MKTTAAAGNKKKKGLKPLSLIGIAIMLVMLLQMLMLFAFSKTSEGSSPALVLTGQGIKIPETSMKTAMGAAGFDFYTLQSSSDGQVSFAPETVILAVGDEAFPILSAYADDPNVMGFVLVDPSFPGNAAMEGFNRYYPAKPVAIFSGKETWSSVSNLPSEALLYERMTGDDTVYGVPVTRGRYLSSKVFIDNSMDRYLSFAGYKASGELLLYSPLFQNELAGYLSSAYHDHVSKIQYNKINMRLFFFVISVFVFISGLLIYAAPMSTSASSSKMKGRWFALLIASLVLCGVAAGAGAFIKRLTLLRGVAIVSPLVFGIVSGFAVLLYNMKNNKKLVFSGKGRALRPVFMIIVTSGFVLLFSLLTGDMTGTSKIFPVILVACAADVLIQTVTFASEAPVYSLSEMMIMMIPVPVMIVSAVFFGCPALLAAVPALIFPLIFSRFIRNVSEYPYMAALAHGLILGIAVLLG